MRLGSVVLMVSICAASAAAVRAAHPGGPGLRTRQGLPDGQGREVTRRLCDNQCHGKESFISEHRSKSQWVETIDQMKGSGAKGSDEDFKTAIGYLVAHFGIPVKINQATAKMIDDLLVLEPGQAEAIVKYRDANGTFADWQDLMRVPGLDPKKLEEQKANVVF